MLGRVKTYIIAATAFVAALFGIYWRGKSDGAEAERDEETERRLQDMQTAKEVRDDVESDSDLVGRAERWVRPKDE